MQFKPLTPTLQAIPRDTLLTAETASVLSDMVGELDTMADRLKQVKATSHVKVRQLSNNILSVANAIEDGEGNIEMMRALRTSLEKFDVDLLEIETEYSSAKAGPSRERYSDEIATLEQAMAGYTVDDPKPGQETANSLNADLETVLKNLSARNRSIQRVLPRVSKVDKFSIIRLPILVLVENKLDPKKLDKMGFEVTDMEGYPVIEGQMVLAVRTEYAKQWDLTTGDVAEEIIETLSKNGSQAIKLVSDEGRSAKGSTGFIYYWIMPERYYNKLMPVMGSFSDWSIAQSSAT